MKQKWSLNRVGCEMPVASFLRVTSQIEIQKIIVRYHHLLRNYGQTG